MKLERKHLEKAMDYLTYRKLIDTLLLEGKTTGRNQSASLTEYARLNVARMKRVDKTIEIIPDLQKAISAIKSGQTWVVITEGWCGDTAQIVPVFYALSKLNDKINLQLVLRDENTELMDQYLTNGKSRSIPKLIVTRTENLEEIFNWGPRPERLQKQFYKLREQNLPYKEITEKLHSWYSKDKTITTQKELLTLFTNMH
ncbi:thioredoxin family protein [Segetibacter koreensis]|uniref:thioredoxin family protein n=1 Tax=Segetibacter koreensis TaxID=398037 RepID=UPI0003659AF2|nr:thioredoxin family protein [Segetibacter koreensis]